VLAADVAGYSRLMGIDEEGTLARLKAVKRALVDPAIATSLRFRRRVAGRAAACVTAAPKQRSREPAIGSRV
jgi:class 3 adenylate cyclase